MMATETNDKLIQLDNEGRSAEILLQRPGQDADFSLQTQRVYGLLKSLSERSERVSEKTLKEFSSEREAYNWVVSSTHELCRIVDELEAGRARVEDIEEAIKPAVTAQSKSPFAKRMQQWPRGYPGDFETIEYLCDGKNTAPRYTLGHIFERYFLCNPPVFQHRNKLEAQAARIRTACLSKSKASILIVACGGARDLLSVLDIVQNTHARLTLNDIDPDALSLCRQRFSCLENLALVTGNVFKLINKLASMGPYDLVVCGGLFDYVPDAFLKRFVPVMIDKLLADDGELFFTNISEGNPYRTWMEYFGNWKLIERSEDAIRKLLLGNHGREPRIEITKDSTDLTYLVDLRK